MIAMEPGGGEDVAQVNLTRENPSYVLEVTATNSEGSASESLELSWDLEQDGAVAGEDENGQQIEGEEDNGNHPPVIEDLVFSDNDVYTGHFYEITVVCFDPDGESLSYSWEVSGGSIRSVNGDTIEWGTEEPGAYTIEVEVTDENGAKAFSNAMPFVQEDMDIEPALDVISVTDLAIVANECGYLEGGDDGRIYNNPTIYVGDSNLDRACYGYVSFDASEIEGSRILNAKLSFTLNEKFGNPNPLGNIRVFIGYYGTGLIDRDDWWTRTWLIYESANPTFTIDSEELKEKIQESIDSGKDRIQFILRYPHDTFTDFDGNWDGIAYKGSDIKLTIDYI